MKSARPLTSERRQHANPQRQHEYRGARGGEKTTRTLLLPPCPLSFCPFFSSLFSIPSLWEGVPVFAHQASVPAYFFFLRSCLGSPHTACAVDFCRTLLSCYRCCCSCWVYWLLCFSFCSSGTCALSDDNACVCVCLCARAFHFFLSSFSLASSPLPLRFCSAS